MITKIYRLMVPPFEMKSFKEMNKKEAKQFFDWYIGEIPNRIEQLKDTFELLDGGSKDILDFTPESLKPLWAWFIPQIKLVQRTEEEIQKEVERMPPLLKDVITPNKYKLSAGTFGMAFDIGIYFAETFIKNHEGINWGFFNKPKSRADVNRPVLLGFNNKVDLAPHAILHIKTLKVVDGDKNPEALYNTYNVWRERASKNNSANQITGNKEM